MPLSEPQRQVILSDKRFRVLLSGRRFGKTHVALQELAKFGQYSNKKIFYISPSYRQSKEIMWKPLKEKMLEHRWVAKINETQLTLYLRNGTQISLKSGENFESMRGSGLSFVCFDESQDIKPEAWYEVIRPTLSDKYTMGSALFCGTPKGYGNWSYELYSKKDSEWESFKFTTIEGGQVTQEEIDQAKNDLDERTFQQEYLATFVNYAGVIYYNFDRNKHIIDTYEQK